MKASLRSLSSLCGLLGVLGIVSACSGDDGKTGEAGPAGEQGEQGERGEAGPTGEAGPAGEQGPQGDLGTPGETGAQGETGAMGNPGAMGDPGAMGNPGAAGPKGDQGEQGDPADSPPVGLSVEFLGRHSAGAFDKGAAEIVSFDKESKRVFVVNALAATVDVLDITNPATPTKLQTIDVKAADALKTLGSANSVSTKNGVLAVAIEASPKTDPGIVAFYATDTLALLGTASVGALPDMLTFTPDGTKVLVANEGEPSDDYLTDPEGSVSIITLPAAWTSAPTVQTVGFAALNSEVASLRAEGVRVFGPNATVAQDFEPEYIALSADGVKAWVTLQENNALAIVDVATATLLDVVPLGFKNHALLGNELDASDQDQAINIRNWPVFGMYMPDAIASYEVAGQTYLVTANEGDTRDYPGFSEIVRVGSNNYLLDAAKFPDAATLKLPANLGRLNVTKTLGGTANPNEFNAIYTFGARSFSVWTASGEQVYDSGSEIELRTAKRFPKNFNASNTSNAFDNRSDDKGPEPEAVTIGNIGGTPFAFIGLERVGGVLVYDLTLPENPRFVSYINSRDFAAADIQTNGGDLGPEASVFIPAEDSPTGKPLLVLGNEISGTTALFELTPLYGAAP